MLGTERYKVEWVRFERKRGEAGRRKEGNEVLAAA